MQGLLQLTATQGGDKREDDACTHYDLVKHEYLYEGGLCPILELVFFFIFVLIVIQFIFFIIIVIIVYSITRMLLSRVILNCGSIITGIYSVIGSCCITLLFKI